MTRGGGLVAAALAPVLVLGLMVVGGGGGDEAGDAPTVQAGAGGAALERVPEAYRALVEQAGAVCPLVTPALVAAQLWQESRFDPAAGSAAGAQGIAQFMPDTWATHGRDGDGDGKIDVWEPADAIASQAAYMCELADTVQGYIDSGTASGDPVELALAAYNAGPGAVEEYGGVPPYTETQGYVETITADAAAPGTSGVGGADRGQTVLAAARSRVGTPYVWGGESDSGLDCSGLVMVAYRAAGVELPHSSAAQCSGTRVDKASAQPGDLVCWGGHVAVWAGDDMIVEAPQPGGTVRETEIYYSIGIPWFVRVEGQR